MKLYEKSQSWKRLISTISQFCAVKSKKEANLKHKYKKTIICSSYALNSVTSAEHSMIYCSADRSASNLSKLFRDHFQQRAVKFSQSESFCRSRTSCSFFFMQIYDCSWDSEWKNLSQHSQFTLVMSETLLSEFKTWSSWAAAVRSLQQ